MIGIVMCLALIIVLFIMLKKNIKLKKLSLKRKVIIVICIIMILILIHCLINISKKEYDGEYQLITIDYDNSFDDEFEFKENYMIIDNYEKYEEIISKYNESLSELAESDESEMAGYKFNESFFEDYSLVLLKIQSTTEYEEKIKKVDEDNDIVNIKFSRRSYGSVAIREIKEFYFIPISKGITDVKVEYKYK